MGNFFVEGEDCGANGSFGFYVVPRLVFVLLAVVEPKGSAINIDGASFVIDDDSALRPAPGRGRLEDMRFSPITIKRGESFVIPLHIELRYDTDQFPFTAIKDNGTSSQFYASISGLPVTQFSVALDVPGDNNTMIKIKITKDKSAFNPPTSSIISGKYFFGKSRELTGIFIDGKKIETRPTPRVAVVMNGRFEEGSCPFLYFKDGDDNLSMVGRVLIGADGVEREREEHISIARGVRAFVLSEAEPEVSFIRSLDLQSETGEIWNIGANFYIGPNKAFEFQIPERFREKGQIRIKGYYKTLNSAQVGGLN